MRLPHDTSVAQAKMTYVGLDIRNQSSGEAQSLRSHPRAHCLLLKFWMMLWEAAEIVQGTSRSVTRD